jgi:Kef-type K+ transport system membrane component KefB
VILQELSQAWTQLLASPVALLAALFLIVPVAAQVLTATLRVPRFTSLVVCGLGVSAVASHAGNFPLAEKLLPWLEALTMVMLFEVGQRVSFSWLRRNPALLVTSLLEFVLTIGACYFALKLLTDIGPVSAALIAVLCAAGSPVVVLAVSKDMRSRGQITERAILFATLSTVFSVLLLQLLLSGAAATSTPDLRLAIHPIFQLCGSFLLGLAGAIVLLLIVRTTRLRGPAQSLVVVAACIGLYAVSLTFDLSALLTALAFGLITRALDSDHRIAGFELSEVGALFAIAFFVLVGATLTWQTTSIAVIIALVVILVRLGVKTGVHALMATPGALAPRRGALVGLSQAPLSSVTLLLSSVVQAGYPALDGGQEVLTAIVLILAIIGPAVAELALTLAKESTKENPA